MKNKLYILLIILIIVVPAKGQQKNVEAAPGKYKNIPASLSTEQGKQGDVGPKKGTVNISLLMGKTQSFGGWLTLPDANSTSYSIQTPGMNSSISDNPAINMIGIEGKWFFSNKWALRVSGMGNISAAKGYEGSPGVPATSDGTVLLPFYGGVPSLTNHEVIANLGVDRYFATPNNHLFWYLAPVINFHYNRLTGKNSTDYSAMAKAPYFNVVDPGTVRYGEGVGLGLSGIAGVEYYATGGFVFGFEVRGVNYTYLLNSQRPMDGLNTLKSDCHNFSILSQPTLKIGFKF